MLELFDDLGQAKEAIKGVVLRRAGRGLDSGIFSFRYFNISIALGVLFVTIFKLNILVSNLDGIVVGLDLRVGTKSCVFPVFIFIGASQGVWVSRAVRSVEGLVVVLQPLAAAVPREVLLISLPQLPEQQSRV